MSNKDKTVNYRSVTDQNIKHEVRNCIQWIFKTSGDSKNQYPAYLNGWIKWLEFGIRNAYYSVLVGWVHSKLDADKFIDPKRLNDLIRSVCEQEMKNTKE